jgi:hypothetical protein
VAVVAGKDLNPRPLGCQRRLNFDSGTVLVGLVGERDAEAEQAGVGAAVHLSFEHLNDAVDVALRRCRSSTAGSARR